MPPRLLAVTIVAFWLATTSWLLWRDLWPRFRTGEPPRVALDVMDEAGRKFIRWRVFRNDKPIGRARTWTEYHVEDDSYSLHSDAKNLDLTFSFLATVHVQRLASIYRVGRGGELHSLSADLRAVINSRLLKDDVTLAAHLSGTMREGRFEPVGWYEFQDMKRPLALEPIDLPAQSVLNPLHPVNRLLNVRGGQRWRIPLVDPLATAVQRSLPAVPGLAESRPRVLDAEVLVEPRSLEWSEGEASCLVIEYRSNDELTARTWVQVGDGLVLRQEAMQGGEMLVLQRE